MLAKLDEMKDMVFILMITAFYVAIANFVGWNGELLGGAFGCLILAALTFLGVLLSKMPILNKIPLVFWVSFVAIVVSIPGFPGGEWVIAQTKQISFLAATTPILAYGGLCLGKDIDAFKKLSWRIVPVGLAVTSGSFLCATALAEVMLHLEGIF